MPKAEKGSIKDLNKRMKSKGLQKLKFFCQMCNKQCRDENGFKCHLTSDSHLRNMKSFCSNASGMLDGFSKQFEKMYLDTLYRRHRTKKMNSNHVYQEVIQDKEHVHMNATKWSTLTDFVQYLGKIGKCVVEETERGWYVTYIERDPTILAQQENYKKRVEAEKKEEKKFAKRMEQQRVEAAILMDKAGIGLKVEASALKREISDAPIAMSLGGGNDKKKKSQTKVKKSVFGDDDESDGDENIQKEAVSQKESLSRAVRKEVEESIRISDAKASKKRKRSDDLTPNELQKEENIKEKEQYNDQGSKDHYGKEKWIRKDILVRIISKKVAKGKYYKRKGVINRVYDKFTAEVEILDSAPGKRDGGKILEIDQDRLETVVPKEGKKVMLLNGKNRGFLAELLSADKEKYRATLKMLDDGKVLKKVDFEEFSKYNP